MPTEELAVIGDDLGMDIALGRLGGARTILVRSGISGAVDLDRVPEQPPAGRGRRRRRRAARLVVTSRTIAEAEDIGLRA